MNNITDEEREVIMIRLQLGDNPNQIATLLGRHRSSIYREIGCREEGGFASGADLSRGDGGKSTTDKTQGRLSVGDVRCATQGLTQDGPS